MIIKPLKGRNDLVLSLIVLLLVLFLNFRFINLEILAENFREKILSYDLGFSRFHNISDSSSEKSKQLISIFKKMPSIFYSNIIGYDRNYIEKLDIDIKLLDYAVILSDRDKALKFQILSDPHTVNAVIKYKNQAYNAEVRLKGDLSDHWTAVSRMSLRINLKGGNTIHGLNEFNIQKLRTRHYPYDAVFQDTIRSTGNLATEHNYVKVAVNGSNWGVMNLESHIDKEFLERNQKKESLVVRFSNEDGWLYQKTNNNFANKYYRLSDPALFSKAYSSSKNFDITKRKIYTYVVEERIKKNSELYDVDSYTRLLLLAKLWGEMHVLYENNTKHYFNPYTLRLEPISSDQYQPKKLIEDGDVFTLMGKCIDDYAFIMEEPYQSIKNTNEYSSNIMNNYNLVLDKVSLVEDLFEESHGYFPLDNEPSKEILNTNLLVASNLGKKIFTINDQCKEEINSDILSKWSEANYNISQLTQAHHYDDGRIKIFNLLPDNLNILGIRVDEDKFVPINFEITGHDNKTYKPYIIDTDYKGIFDDRLEIVAQYQGKTKYQKLYKTLISGVNNPLSKDNAQNFEFITKKLDDVWLIPSGNWLVNQPIIVEGDLHISPGVNLQFSNDSYLIVKGSLTAIGGKNNPIIFNAISDKWKGIYVLNADKKSHLKNVNITDISALEDELLKLTGGITFYESDVDFENVRVSSVNAEDAINIVNSSFSLKSVVIDDTVSDGLDSDFSEGNILYSEFLNIGGDALDFSGSNVSINQTKASKVKDKAVSAGEESILIIENSNFSNIGAGVVSKDGSQVSVFKTLFKDVSLSPAMTFIKKSFYEAPKLVLQSCDIDVNSDLIAQTGTSITVDGIQIETQYVNVEKLYKTNVMKNE